MSFVDCNELVNFNNFDFITTGKVKKNQQGINTIDYIPTNPEIGFNLTFKLSNVKDFSFDGEFIKTKIDQDIVDGCNNIFRLNDYLISLIDYKKIHKKLFSRFESIENKPLYNENNLKDDYLKLIVKDQNIIITFYKIISGLKVFIGMKTFHKKFTKRNNLAEKVTFNFNIKFEISRKENQIQINKYLVLHSINIVDVSENINTFEEHQNPFNCILCMEDKNKSNTCQVCQKKTCNDCYLKWTKYNGCPYCRSKKN